MPEDATPAEIIDILGRAGTKGVTKIKCRVIEGKDTGKILLRNVMGPIRLGDVVMLRETEMESSGSYGRR